MSRLMSRRPSHQTGGRRPTEPRGPASRPDLRGWMALAWVVFWGWAYALMVIQARSPQVHEWMRTLSRIVDGLTRLER
jgi:hypothetical protein